MIEVIGWTASVVLVATIFAQIHRQWQAGTSKGVSMGLFIGQIAASAGFAIYSIVLKNYVFIVTNIVTGISAVAGLLIVTHHRRHGR